MDDRNLPPGWVARKSKTYPDRVYYFNINTGLSSWEYPDILESIASKNAGNTSNSVPLCTPAVVQPTHKPVDKPDTSHVSKMETPRKMQNPGHNLMFRGRSAPRALPYLNKSRRVSTEPLENKGPNVSEQLSTSLPSASDVLSKKLKKSPPKSPLKNRSTKPSVPQTKSGPSSSIQVHNKTTQRINGKSSSVEKTKPKNGCASSTVQYTCSGSASSSAGSHSSNKKIVVPASKSSVPSVLGKPTANVKNDFLRRKLIALSKRKGEVESKFKSAPTSTLNTDKVKSVKSVKSSESGNSHKASVLNTKLETKLKPVRVVSQTITARPSPPVLQTVSGGSNLCKTVSGKPSPSKAKQKYANTVTPKAKGSKLVHQTKDSNDNNLKSPPVKVSEKDRNVKAKTEETITDLRKVVRAMQQSLKSSRDVSIKDIKISNVKPSARQKTVSGPKTAHHGYMGNNDLTVHTELKLDADLHVGAVPSAAPVAPVIVDDEHNNGPCKDTEFKVFIGDKNKLLNIQSWINNIRDGSASNSPAREELKVPVLNVNESVDSGYTSPLTQRGWPGKLTTSDITSRDIVAMDIDECLIPAPGDYIHENLDEPEDMDIDVVLVEIRDEMKKDGNRKLSSPIGWSEPSDDVVTVDAPPKTVLVVLDTNVLIQNLSLVNNMKSYTLKGNVKPTLFIPWIVLCELDRLKDRPSVMELSRKGISYLKDLFMKKDPQVIGQTPKQSDEASVAFNSACNDDMILQACLQCQQKFNQVILFTNDNNLTVKSLVLGIPACSYKDIYDELRKAAESLSGNISMSNSHVIDTQTGSSPSLAFTPTQTGSQHNTPFRPVHNQTFTPTQTGSQHNTPLTGSRHKAIPSQTFTPSQTGSQHNTPLTGSRHRLVHSQTFTPTQTSSQHNTPLTGSRHRPVHSRTFIPTQTGSQHITPLTGSRHRPVPCQTFTPIQKPQQQSTCSNTASHSPAGFVPCSPSMIPLPPEPGTKKVKQSNESKSCRSSLTETLPVHKLVPKPSIANRILQEERSYDVEMLIDDMFYKFKDLLKESLTEVLRIEMQSIYEELWLQIVHKKPPWSLMDILLSLQKHWRAVFGMVLGRHHLDHIENLIKSTAKVKINRICDILDMLYDGCVILEQAKDKPDYGRMVLDAYNTVTTLRDLCTEVIKEKVNVSSIQSLDQYLFTKVKANGPATAPAPTSSTSSRNCVVITADDFKKPVINTNHSSTIVTSKHSICTSNQQSSTPNNIASIHSASSPAFPPSVPTASIPPANILPANVPSAIVPPTAPQGDACNVDYQEMVAGERFSTIWNFIFKYCEQFQQSILVNDPTLAVKNEVEPMLKVLVSVALELRKYYVELIELPVERLGEHEKEFMAFSEICNNFFSLLNVQEEAAHGKVTPIHLLVIYSKPEYRQSLTRFRQQLDEMLNMMYLCLHKLCPDD